MTFNVPQAQTVGLIGGVLTVLTIAMLTGQVLKRRLDTGVNPAIVEKFHSRVRAYFLICAVLAVAFVLGPIATVVLFGFISFWALREFITITPTRPGDHRGLFWMFIIFTPLQYCLVAWLGPHGRWLMSEETALQLFAVALPVFAFLFITARVAFAGDFKQFLERIAKMQAGLMISVYCLSHAPALLTQEIPAGASDEAKSRLLFFFVLIVQLGDVMQYVWNALIGKRVIAPDVNPSKTWEGFAGAVGSAAVLGALLWWATPFEPWEAALLSAIVATVGFAGGLIMSAIKRDRGVEDYGTLVVGHGGVLDRIDSICFGAPVFFYLTRVVLGSV